MFFYSVSQVLFATFDPPVPPTVGAIGHFCVVALNIKKKRIELLDSLRGHRDPDAKRVIHLMARNIKKLWKNTFEITSLQQTPKDKVPPFRGFFFHKAFVLPKITFLECPT